MIILCISANEGRLARWESGGEHPRLTHAYEHGCPATFTQEVLDEMRSQPPEHMAVQEPNDSNPPPSGTPVAARIAA